MHKSVIALTHGSNHELLPGAAFLWELDEPWISVFFFFRTGSSSLYIFSQCIFRGQIFHKHSMLLMFLYVTQQICIQNFGIPWHFFTRWPLGFSFSRVRDRLRNENKFCLCMPTKKIHTSIGIKIWNGRWPSFPELA